jgi:hypothetical protein
VGTAHTWFMSMVIMPSLRAKMIAWFCRRCKRDMVQSRGALTHLSISGCCMHVSTLLKCTTADRSNPHPTLTHLVLRLALTQDDTTARVPASSAKQPTQEGCAWQLDDDSWASLTPRHHHCGWEQVV